MYGGKICAMRLRAALALLWLIFTVSLSGPSAVAAAGGCHLEFGSVPHGVVGINLLGVGFAPKASVTVTETRRPTGAAQDVTSTSTATTNAGGVFAVTIDPRGATAITVIATDGSCTAGGPLPAAALLPGTPPVSPQATLTTIAPGNVNPPPPTDTVTAAPDSTSPLLPALPLLLIVCAAAFALLFFRPAARR